MIISQFIVNSCLIIILSAIDIGKILVVLNDVFGFGFVLKNLEEKLLESVSFLYI